MRDLAGDLVGWLAGGVGEEAKEGACSRHWSVGFCFRVGLRVEGSRNGGGGGRSSG